MKEINTPGPLQRPVRSLVERLEAAAHAWEHSLTVCGDHMPSPAMLREAKAEIELLRKPLTLEQIQALSRQHNFDSRMEKFVRIVEAAHGIKEGT